MQDPCGAGESVGTSKPVLCPHAGDRVGETSFQQVPAKCVILPFIFIL